MSEPRDPGLGFSPRVVRCPTCGGDALYAPGNPSRPFCSPRCKSNDFGAWAAEAFTLEAKPGGDADELDDDPNR